MSSMATADRGMPCTSQQLGQLELGLPPDSAWGLCLLGESDERSYSKGTRSGMVIAILVRLA